MLCIAICSLFRLHAFVDHRWLPQGQQNRLVELVILYGTCLVSSRLDRLLLPGVQSFAVGGLNTVFLWCSSCQWYTVLLPECENTVVH